MPPPLTHPRDRDVELALAEANLARLDAHFQATIEQLPIGIAHADIDDRITRFNTAFCTLLGRSPQELLGKRFAEITYPDDQDGSAAALQRLWRGEVPHYVIDKRYLKKDGTIVWAHVTVAPSRDADGRLDGAVGILEDITERKAAEAEIARMHQELLRASRQAGMAEIAANVLHHVGNVLNSLNVSATLVAATLKTLRGDALARVVTMLEDNAHDLKTFLTEHDRGARIPDYLSQLSRHLQSTQQTALTEMKSLTDNIEHIKQIIAAQQAHAIAQPSRTVSRRC